MSLTACKVSVVWIGGYLVFFLTFDFCAMYSRFWEGGKKERVRYYICYRQRYEKTHTKLNIF